MKIREKLAYIYGKLEPRLLAVFNKLLKSKFFTRNKVGRGVAKAVAVINWYLPYGVVIPYPLLMKYLEKISGETEIYAGPCPCKKVYAKKFGADKVEDPDLLTDIVFFAGIGAGKAYGIENYRKVDLEWLRKNLLLYTEKKLVPTVYACFRSKKFIFVLCNCDPRYCVPLRAYMAWGKGISSSPYVSARDKEKCEYCMQCFSVCPVKAIGKDLEVDANKCLGCGLCVYHCPTGARFLDRREGWRAPRFAKFVEGLAEKEVLVKQLW